MNKKKLVLGISLLTIFGLSIGLNTDTFQFNPSTVNNAATHDPITLRSNAELNAFCAGNGTDGTSGNPHIIEGFEISGSTGWGISLENIDLYVIIRDCTIFGFGWGIDFEYGENVNITGNTMTNCEIGIFVRESNFCNISNNIISYASNSGIFFQSGPDDCTIENNTISNVGTYGIFLDFGTDRIRILENSIINAAQGILGGLYVECFDNLVANNTISQCSQTGISYSEGGNNVFVNNSISYCAYGISAYMEDGDHILNNTIRNCSYGLSVFWETNTEIKFNHFINYDTLMNNNTNVLFEDNLLENSYLISSEYNTDSIEYETTPSWFQIDSSTTNNSIDFSMNGSGWIFNTSIMDLGYYSVEASLNDTDGNRIISVLNVLIRDTINPEWVESFNTVRLPLGQYTFDVNASDNYEIDTYWLTSTTHFTIDPDTGIISNTTYISIGGSDMFFVRVNDTSGNEISQIITLYFGSHNPILINGNDELDAFTDKVGAGTEADPYVIGGFLVDARFGTGVDIRNTDKYLVVKEFIIDDGSVGMHDGIYLYNVSNFVVQSNTLDNHISGINTDYCKNGSIIDNTCTNNEIGINITHTNGTLISNNNILDSSDWGLSHSWAYWNNISDNYLENNDYAGIITSVVYNTMINNNVITGSYRGMSIQEVWDSVLLNNTVSSCTYGIQFQFSSDDIIENNTCFGNFNRGFDFGYVDSLVFRGNNATDNVNGMVLDTDNSEVSENIAIHNTGSISMNIIGSGNTVQNNYIEVMPTSNQISAYDPYSSQISIPTWLSVTSNIVNDSTNFQVSTGGLVSNKTILSPQIYYIQANLSDSNGNQIIGIKTIDVYETDPPEWNPTLVDQTGEAGESFYYDINATDISLPLTFSLNDSSVFQIDSETGELTNFGSLEAGVYWLRVYVEDSVSNSVDDILKITISDTQAPVWNPSPVGPTIEVGSALSFDIDADDATAIDEFWLNDTTWLSIGPSGQLENATFLPVGRYAVEVFVNDTFGNEDSIVLTITVEDTVNPSWNPEPTDQTVVVGRVFSYDANITDYSPVGQFWINDTTNFYIDPTTGILTNITVLLAQDYWITIYVNDTSGNQISAEFKIMGEDTLGPDLTPTPVDQVLEYGEDLSLDINAYDPSGLSIFWINSTTNFEIDTTTGVLSNIGTLQLGIYWVNISVNDTMGNEASHVVKITIQDTIAPEWIDIPEDQVVPFGEILSYDINATDLHGIVSYSVNDTRFIISEDGVLTNSTALEAGEYIIEISARDSSGNEVSITISIQFTAEQKSDIPSLDTTGVAIGTGVAISLGGVWFLIGIWKKKHEEREQKNQPI